MAGLSINPNGTNGSRENGRTLAEIIADEEYLESEEPVQKEKEEKKMKFMSFELDMTYPRTLKGFMRIIQVLLLLVAFICLVITSSWPSQGVYSFYCVVLVFGALLSGFLFFTVLAGTRKKGMCGMSWVKIELIYFVLFGFIIFIGACLAASNSDSNPALNAGAAFGFISTITFVIYIFWTWKEYKNPPEDEDEDKDKEENESGNISDVESQKGSMNGSQFRQSIHDDSMERNRNVSMIDPPENHDGDLRIDAPMHQRQKEGNGQTPQYRSMNGKSSLEKPLSIISRNELIDPKIRNNQHRRSVHRRRHSGSDKDSAYSEGSMFERDRSLPTKIRRTASARAEDRRRNSDRGRKQRSFDGKRHPLDGLPNQDDIHQRKAVPSWLRAALECDNNSDLGMRRVSTMPGPRRNEFPLLHMSDEESIAYPSVSQNYGNGEHFGPPATHGNTHGGERIRQHAHRGGRMGHNHRHQMSHGHQARRGKRLNQFGGGYNHRNGRRHMHGNHRGHGGKRGGRHGRIHHGHRGNQRSHNDDFSRRMMENNLMNGPNMNIENMPVGQFNYPNQGLKQTEENKRVFPKQPSSIHFPEKSRWDDNEPVLPGEYGGPNNMIEKYLNGQ